MDLPMVAADSTSDDQCLEASSAKLVYDTLMKTASDHRRHLVQDLRNGALAELVLAMWKEWNEPLSGLSVCDLLDGNRWQ